MWFHSLRRHDPDQVRRVPTSRMVWCLSSLPELPSERPDQSAPGDGMSSGGVCRLARTALIRATAGHPPRLDLDRIPKNIYIPTHWGGFLILRLRATDAATCLGAVDRAGLGRLWRRWARH